MGYWQDAMKAIKDADLVLLVIDARLPELSRNEDLERKLFESDKKTIIVFNKSDLISESKLAELKKKNKKAHFVSATEKEGLTKLRTEIIIEAKKRGVKIEVGVVGYPNVGKSALTNALTRGSKSKVSSSAGTTKGVQWASSNQMKIIDSPGVIPFEDDEVKLGVLGAKNPDKLKDPEGVALAIVKIFLDNDRSVLERHYKIKISGEDEYEILLQIGKARKLLKKGGVVDENRTSKMIIKEWQVGKIKT